MPGRQRGRRTMTTSRTRRGLVCAAAVFTVLTLAACSEAAGDGGSTAGGAGATSDFAAQSGDGTTTDQAKVPAPQAPGTVAEGEANALATGALDDRSIIRTGTMRLRSDEVEKAALQAAAAARALGGLVAGEQTVSDPDNPDRTVADLTLRVPSDRFDDLLVKVRGLGTVLGQTQQAADVTGQVADVDARVEAQRASVRRIQALLARANTIGEVVTVEGQLAQRQADLGVARGPAEGPEGPDRPRHPRGVHRRPRPRGHAGRRQRLPGGPRPRVARLHGRPDRRAHGLRRAAPVRRLRAADPAPDPRLAAVADPSDDGPAASAGAVRAAGTREPAGRLTARAAVSR